VLLAVALAGGSLLLVAVLRSTLRDDVRSTVNARARELADELDSGSVPESLALPRTDDLVAQVVRGDAVVVQSPALRATAPIAEADAGSSVARLPGEDDEFFASSVAAGGYRVIVAGTPEGADEAAAALGKVLVVAAPVMVVLLAATTWVAVGRALSPVDAMAREVDTISLSDLHRRVPADGTDQLARLGGTMNRMLDRLEAAVVRQRQFVGDASHELRSPVTSLRHLAEVADAHPGRTTVAALAEGVLAEALRMQRLVDDLLLLARVDEDRQGTAAVAVDLDDLIADAAVPTTAGIRVSTPGLRPVQVCGDRAALDRVVRNLADNARRHARSLVELTVERHGATVVLHVDDDGPGIPVADRERVLERFVRLDDSRARDGGGTGLGLAIVADLVRLHGGTVTVSDSPLGGARIEVRLPVFSQRTGAPGHADADTRREEP